MPLKMISVAKSIGTCVVGIPRSWTRPPRLTQASAWCSADDTPDISHTTSAPSPPVAARTLCSTSSRPASMVTWAPIRCARARRLAFTSEAITRAAPAARAIPTAKHPIGPHPTTNTVLPGISAVSTVWKALPMGSMTAPTVVGMPSSGRTLVAGIAMYAADAPGRSTPMILVLRQMWPLPVRHWRQCPHTMCPSAVTSWPAVSSATPSPTATISPANSWPTTSGGLMRPCAHASQSAMCRSVPHTPAWRTAISTSPGPADGLGTVVTVRPGARCGLTIACIGGGVGRAMRDRSEDGAREAAVHLEHGAADVARPLRAEERDRRGELVGPSHAAHRDVGDHLLHHLLRGALLALGAGLRELLDPLRGDESRADDVDGDPVRRHLVRERLREAEHAGARGGREDEPRERLLRGHGREANDAAELHLAHDGNRGAGEVHRREQVQLDRAVKRLPGLVAERCRRRTARVAEQHVQPAQLARHPLDQALGLRGGADVRDESRHRASRLDGELSGDPLDGVLVAAVDRHARPLLRQRLGHRAAEPLRAAADERDAAGESEIHGAGIYGDGKRSGRANECGMRNVECGMAGWAALAARPPTSIPHSAFRQSAGTGEGASPASIRPAQHLSSALLA